MLNVLLTHMALVATLVVPVPYPTRAE